MKKDAYKLFTGSNEWDSSFATTRHRPMLAGYVGWLMSGKKVRNMRTLTSLSSTKMGSVYFNEDGTIILNSGNEYREAIAPYNGDWDGDKWFVIQLRVDIMNIDLLRSNISRYVVPVNKIKDHK